MSDWVIEWIARTEGVSPEQLKTIEDAIPAAQELLALAQQAMPLVNKALPLIKTVSPAAQIILAIARKGT